jgi:hypothetical protein
MGLLSGDPGRRLVQWLAYPVGVVSVAMVKVLERILRFR